MRQKGITRARTTAVVSSKMGSVTVLSTGVVLRTPSVDLNSDPGLTSASDSDSISDSDPGPELTTRSDTYEEPEKEQAADIRSCDAEPDSEAEAILGDIARFKIVGPAKPKHTPRTTELWTTESGFWET